MDPSVNEAPTRREWTRIGCRGNISVADLNGQLWQMAAENKLRQVHRTHLRFSSSVQLCNPGVPDPSSRGGPCLGQAGLAGGGKYLAAMELKRPNRLGRVAHLGLAEVGEANVVQPYIYVYIYYCATGSCVALRIQTNAH
eukprot:366531-Chlamydomonas_euryale.AAC.9